jgi:hypothetical protein
VGQPVGEAKLSNSGGEHVAEAGGHGEPAGIIIEVSESGDSAIASRQLTSGDAPLDGKNAGNFCRFQSLLKLGRCFFGYGVYGDMDSVTCEHEQYRLLDRLGELRSNKNSSSNPYHLRLQTLIGRS